MLSATALSIWCAWCVAHRDFQLVDHLWRQSVVVETHPTAVFGLDATRRIGEGAAVVGSATSDLEERFPLHRFCTLFSSAKSLLLAQRRIMPPRTRSHIHLSMSRADARPQVYNYKNLIFVPKLIVCGVVTASTSRDISLSALPGCFMPASLLYALPFFSFVI